MARKIGWQHSRQVLATLSPMRLLPSNFFAKKYFFSRDNNFEKKKFGTKKFLAKKIGWQHSRQGWQHSRQGLATLSSGVYDDVDNIDWLPNPQF